MPARFLEALAVLAVMMVPAMAEEAVLLHAAGSLRGALTEMARNFEAAGGGKVQAKFGASGLLKDEISAGAKAEVFASANMEHPQALALELDGVWATAPYLHNGAVPTLKDMLLPQDQRATKFCVGSREFDPVDVGLVVKAPKDDGKASKGEAGSATKERKDEDCAPGLTTFDVTLQGNSNRGHSFEGVERDKKSLPAGVIGPAFSDGQRKALIE